MTVHEPVTFLTDLLLALAGAVAARGVWRSDDRARRSWSGAFVAMASAALLGGSYHGFGPALPGAVAAGLWHLTLLALCAMSFALINAIAWTHLAGRARQRLRTAALLQALGFALWTCVQPVFFVAIASYALAFTLLAVFEVRSSRRGERVRAGWLLAGVGLTALAAVVQQARLGLDAHVNHNDVYHLVQLAALGFLYRGAREAKEAAAAPVR